MYFVFMVLLVGLTRNCILTV